jgi:hypothetical protein
MKAYTVVGPMNFQPSFFKSFDKASDSAEVEAVCGSASCFMSGS